MKNKLSEKDFPVLVIVGSCEHDFLLFSSPKDVAGKNFEILEKNFQCPEMLDLLKRIYEIAWQKGYNKAEENRRWENAHFETG